MENNFQKQLSCNYKPIIIDEIALEGLDGIGIDLLWRRIEKRISSPITMKMKARFWNFILDYKDVTFYQLPEAPEKFKILDRFTIVDEESGHLMEPEDYLDGPYEYHPVESEHGSSINILTRTLVDKRELHSIPYDQVAVEYGDTLVMVASIEQRWHALAPHMPITHMSQLTPVHFCILELVGRSRDNGQMTVGKTNLTKIMKDSKLLFYNRNFLKKMDLIRAQCLTQNIAGKGVKSILLRLKRFHQPAILSMPKVGKLREVIDHLSTKPEYMDRTDILIKKGTMTQAQCKRLQKAVNIFSFVEKQVVAEETTSKNAKAKKVELKRRFMVLTSPSDESSETEHETNDEPLKCRYKIGVNLLRQAYERFLEAGLKGLTQIEVAQLLGVEFYTARTICRVLKSRKIVREFLEDKGRQRTARYIAVPATGEMDFKYAEEKKKFLEYLVDSQNVGNRDVPTPMKRVADTFDEKSVVPIKKFKLEEPVVPEHENVSIDPNSIEDDVTEVRVLDGLANFENVSLLGTKKCPTLRQLRFANGMLKVIREKLAISGYQTLSMLVSKEINEPPLDTKALKIFVQKLVVDGQMKILKMRWPGQLNKYSLFLCAPHVQLTDPVIKSKYKEICVRAINKNKTTIKTKTPLPDVNATKILSIYAYPRYTKIQKLHEFLLKIVYFSDEDMKELTDLPGGFASLVHIVPEFTVEFALGNISHSSKMSEISQDKITDEMFSMKLRNTPTDVFRMFLLSASLQNAIRTNLKVLAMLGLIQLVKLPTLSGNSGDMGYVFYVNRNAKIIDTTGIWPRVVDSERAVDKPELEKSYYFESFKDVEVFWRDVYDISTKTTIEVLRETRFRKKLMPVVRSPSEVHDNDNGLGVLGDGFGPCGFDSSFYMEIPKLWSTFYCQVKKKHQVMQKKQKIKIPTKREKVKKRKPKVVKKKKPVVVKPPVCEDKSKKTRKRDISSNIPKWTTEEDRILMLCKAAITIMSPVSQPGCLRLRNLVAKDLLSINDPKKLAAACHKRSLQNDSNCTLAYEKDCLINELRHRGNLIHKYEGLLKKLRIRFAGNMSKLMYEGRTPMLELVWILSQLYRSKSFNRRVPCIATNLEDFYTKFTICPSSANRSYNLYKTPLNSEPNIAAIKEGIILSVMLTFKHEQTPDVAKKIYAMFNEHPEQTLRIAIEQLRKCGAVAAKDKLLNNQIHRFNFQDIVQASYKVSASYQRRWISRLNSEFVEKLSETVDSELSQTGLKGCPEINCALFEMQICDALEIITVTIPVITGSSGSIIQEEQLSVIDILAKFKLNSGTCGWKKKLIVKKLSEFYEDTEIEEPLKCLSRNSVVKRSEAPNMDINDKIISHLKNKKDKGSTFPELQEITGYDTKVLIDKLNKLESENVLKRMGYFENLIVLTEYSKPWTMTVDDHLIIPTPWLNLNSDIRCDIFMKWAGVIMNKVFENPGCSILFLSDACELLSTRSAQDVCMFLEKCGCVKLNVIKCPEPDLFSADDLDIEIQEFNEYELVDNIYVHPVKNSLTKFAYLRSFFLEKYRNDQNLQTGIDVDII